jgi:hypothetical protein
MDVPLGERGRDGELAVVHAPVDMHVRTHLIAPHVAVKNRRLGGGKGAD